MLGQLCKTKHVFCDLWSFEEDLSFRWSPSTSSLVLPIPFHKCYTFWTFLVHGQSQNSFRHHSPQCCSNSSWFHALCTPWMFLTLRHSHQKHGFCFHRFQLLVFSSSPWCQSNTGYIWNNKHYKNMSVDSIWFMSNHCADASWNFSRHQETGHFWHKIASH